MTVTTAQMRIRLGSAHPTDQPSTLMNPMVPTRYLVGSAHPTQVGTTQPSECRLIVDPPAVGAWNMAVDEALLIDAAENGVATLRFYAWSEPTLSLGYFQRYNDREQHAASRNSAVVRRQTGGGAILHDREVTYSLALPSTHSLSRDARRLYAAMHDAFIATLTALVPVNHWTLIRRGPDSGASPNGQAFLCFERHACGDVLLVRRRDENRPVMQTPGNESNAVKILGSAQRRYRGAVLQHGSLLLQKSPAAPELAGIADLTGAPITAAELIDALTDRLENVLDARGFSCRLPEGLESNAGHLANTKYGSAAWTKRR